MVGKSNENVFLIQKDASRFAEFEISEFEISRFVCISPLSPSPSPGWDPPLVTCSSIYFQMTFNKAFNRGRIIADQEAKDWVKQQHIAKDEISIQCFPLYSLLLALNQPTVDFFSLDVEGEELNVLRTVPWDDVNIKMMTVEYVHEQKGSADLKTYVESKGYESLLQVSRWDGGVNDIIFRKKGLTH